VDCLGAFPLPVEIADFGIAATMAMIEAAALDAGCEGKIALRRIANGDMFRTDGGHLIVDCAFGSIPDTELLADLLDIVPGIMEHGLFIGIADEAIIASPSGVTVYRTEDGDS
jgi:ribose 5-phosphate isomerase A